MKCPSCGYAKTGSGETRDKGDRVVRARGCHKCGIRFQTVETLVRVTSKLINGKREILRGQA